MDKRRVMILGIALLCMVLSIVCAIIEVDLPPGVNGIQVSTLEFVVFLLCLNFLGMGVIALWMFVGELIDSDDEGETTCADPW